VTIYWKDVFEISEYNYGTNYTAVLITMTDGSGPFKIPTRRMANTTKTICSKMQEYFEHYRQAANG
jgi:hypothetical protein